MCLSSRRNIPPVDPCEGIRDMGGKTSNMKKILIGDGTHFTWLSLAKAITIEYFCTALFVYVATSAVTSGCHTKNIAAASGSSSDLANVVPGSCFLESSNLVNIALAFGGAIAVLVYCAASFSGGHLNPAVTVAFFAAGKIPAPRALAYIIVQCLGSCTASALVLVVDSAGFTAALGAANRLNQGVSVASAWGFETILTCLLVFTVFAATDHERAKETAHLPVLAPFAIGGAVFLAHLVAVWLLGFSSGRDEENACRDSIKATINPARSFGPAAVAHSWDNHWIFWVGPITGGLLAAAIYTLCTVNTLGPKVDHVDSPGTQGHQPAQMMHLPSFAGARGTPQSRPNSAPNLAGQHLSQGSRSGSLGV